MQFFLFFSDLLWSRFVSRTIYLMLPTSIVFCLRLFSLSSRTIPVPQCRQSSVFFCVLSVFYPLSFPPKLLAACLRDVIRAPASYVPSAVLFFMDFSSSILFRTSSFVIFSVQLIFSFLLHTKLSKASNFFLKVSVSVHVSAAYSATLQMVLVYSLRFFSSDPYLICLSATFSFPWMHSLPLLFCIWRLSHSIHPLKWQIPDTWNDSLAQLFVHLDLNLPTPLSWNACTSLSFSSYWFSFRIFESLC